MTKMHSDCIVISFTIVFKNSERNMITLPLALYMQLCILWLRLDNKTNASFVVRLVILQMHVKDSQKESKEILMRKVVK